uniref:Uncharacterized protein n=1 Tax=Klebsiella pneumoniae TaxID=573 RepID=A0A8B0SXN4_KLEPN|nr:hypothetical protein [Klebsiella pneumoniae]
MFAVGYQKPQQNHDVQLVKQPRCSQSDTSSLIRLPMRSKLTPSACPQSDPKPPQTHDVQQVNTTPLFAVGYQKPQQTHYVQPVKNNPVVRSQIPPASSASRCAAS